MVGTPIGRVALVAGASRGIGAATAEAFAATGADVVIAACDSEALEAVGRRIQQAHWRYPLTSQTRALCEPWSSGPCQPMDGSTRRSTTPMTPAPGTPRRLGP